MKLLLRSLPCLFAVSAAPAHADFKLTKPTAWIVEDPQGGPQKAGPCGPESDGDAMLSHAITELKAGATLEVEFDETIPHTGWFRIALAENRSELEAITFSGAGCSYDLGSVPAEPHGNVLADGVGKTETAGPNRSFKEKITIPNKPCEKCTLQVIQVMTDASHGPPECVTYHCADVKIVAAEGGAGGMSGGAGAPSAGHATGGSAHSSVPVRTTTGGMGGDTTKAGSGGAPSTDTLVAAASSQSGSVGKQSKSNSAMMKPASSSGAAGTPAASSGSSMSRKSSKSTSTSADAGVESSAKATDEDTSESADATPTQEAKAEDSGCAVSQPGSRASLVSAALISLASVLLGARRRRSRALAR